MHNHSTLADLGYAAHWRDLFAPHAAADVHPARVLKSARGGAIVATEDGIRLAKPAASLLKAAGSADQPSVGDWVALLDAPDLDVPLIAAVLPRQSAIVRGDPGDTSNTQVLAANIDVVLVVHPIAEGPNVRRIERELALSWESGAVPVVVLTKADLAPSPQDALAAVGAVAPGVVVYLTSAVAGEGLDPVRALLTHGRTAVLIGPSGAGKSTLVNALLGEERQLTREVRVSDGRGRHTTVVRELIQIPGGGMIIDTPGLRGMALTGSETGIEAAFTDIEEAAARCRFRDCAHDGEPGCAVAGAVASGHLSEERVQSYHKLLREARVTAMKTDARLRAEEQRKWKGIRKAARQFQKRTGRE